MNIAFPAIAVLILILPGIVYGKFSSSAGSFRRQLALTEEVSRSLFAALLIQLVSLFFASKVLSGMTGVKPDMQAAVELITGYTVPPADEVTARDALANNWGWVGVYVLATIVCGCVAGMIGKHAAEWWQRDKIKLFANEPDAKRYAEWSDIFTFKGEISADERLFKVFSAILTIGGEPYVYRGQLLDIKWATTGDPDLFILESTERRPIGEVELAKGDEQFYPIEGDTFVIRYSEITTLNIRFAVVRQSALMTDKVALDPTAQASEQG